MRDETPPPALTLSGPLDEDGYVEAVGQRAALFGTERGRFEWWAWPFKVVSDLRLTLRLPGTKAPIALEALAATCEVRPSGLRLHHRGADFGLSQTLVTDPERAVSLWLLELEGDRDFEAELSLTCDLRPMWPAGLGAQLGCRDGESGALALSEETGRVAALIGAPGCFMREAPDGRNLPRRPVRIVVRLKPGVTTPIVFAAAQRPPRVPSAASCHGRELASSGSSSTRAVMNEVRTRWTAAGAEWRAVVERAERHWHGVTRRSAELKCGDPRAERAFAWGQVAAERGWVRTPALGTNQVAGLGTSAAGDRPGFGWIFDGDALIAARILGTLGNFPSAARTLWQAAGRQRADGKLAHEVSLAADLCDWFGRFPYAYYNSTATAEFAPTLSRYVRASGDQALGRALLPKLEAALDWGLSTRDGRGLTATSKAGLGAVQSGPLVEATEVDTTQQAGLYAALRAAEQLAHWLGESERAERWAARAAEVAEAFDRLWDEQAGRYPYALSREGSALTHRSGLGAAIVAAGLGREDRALTSAEQFTHPEVATDWGPRPLGEAAPHYHPDSYDVGFVSPRNTVLAALAAYRVGRTAVGHQLLGTLGQLFGLGARGLVESHLAGDRSRIPAGRASRHVLSSLAFHWAMVDGALGYDASAGRDGAPDRIALRVQHPLPWPELVLRGLRVGRQSFDLRVARRTRRDAAGPQTEVTVELHGAESIELDLRAVLPAHSEVLGVSGANDAAIDFSVRELPSGAEEVRAEPTATGAATLVLRQGPHLTLPVPELDRNRPSVGVRPLRITHDVGGTTLVLAGPPGAELEAPYSSDHEVTVVGADRALRADGSLCLHRTLPEEPDAGQTFASATIVLGIDR